VLAQKAAEHFFANYDSEWQRFDDTDGKNWSLILGRLSSLGYPCTLRNLKLAFDALVSEGLLKRLPAEPELNTRFKSFLSAHPEVSAYFRWTDDATAAKSQENIDAVMQVFHSGNGKYPYSAEGFKQAFDVAVSKRLIRPVGKDFAQEAQMPTFEEKRRAEQLQRAERAEIRNRFAGGDSKETSAQLGAKTTPMLDRKYRESLREGKKVSDPVAYQRKLKDARVAVLMRPENRDLDRTDSKKLARLIAEEMQRSN
jgi:hypothetical protein